LVGVVKSREGEDLKEGDDREEAVTPSPPHPPAVLLGKPGLGVDCPWVPDGVKEGERDREGDGE